MGAVEVLEAAEAHLSSEKVVTNTTESSLIDVACDHLLLELSAPCWVSDPGRPYPLGGGSASRPNRRAARQ